MPKIPQQSQTLPTPPTPSTDLCPQSLSTYDLSIEQVKSSLHIITKMKKIAKPVLTTFKKRYSQFNGLFAAMSSFFVKRKQVNIKKSIQREKRRQLLNKALLRKKAAQSNSIVLTLLDNQTSNPIKPNNTTGPPNATTTTKPPQDDQQQQLPNNNITNNFQLKPLQCYICLGQYQQIDDIYHKHCPKCAKTDKEKRNQIADLSGLTALVTGARIKIGYQICLKLLRDGAKVYATTRFLVDAYNRYQAQKDYLVWKDRLFLVQCDFMAADQVSALIKYIKQRVLHLDILIHNAAQTIVRPASFFTAELQLNSQLGFLPPSENIVTLGNLSTPSLQCMPISNSLTSCPTAEVDLTKKDEFGQPLDTRRMNTWREKIEDVSLFDCMSTQVINSTVPFFITGQLRVIMGGVRPSWVINVSSMEGVFNRNFKSCFHPHTNMAKASLNMITRTCANQLSRQNIFMSSVDTGWVTNENPGYIAARMNIKYDFTPPLDCIDGAMRVLDPVYQGVRDRIYIFGKFLKNYMEFPW